MIIKTATRPISGSVYRCQLRYWGVDRNLVSDINRLTRVALEDFPQLEEKDIQVEIIDNPNGPPWIGIGFDVMFDINIPSEYIQVIK